MIEEIVLAYLAAQLNVPVVMEVPDNAPESFVLVEKTGSSVTNRIPTATMAVQSYGPRLVNAAELNEDVKTAMDGMTMLPEIGSVRLNSDYNFTNPTTKKYRYQAVFVITYTE